MIKKLIAFFTDKSIIPFLLIGGGNTLITLVGCQLLYEQMGYWGSTAFMFAVCSIASFILNRRFSFNSKAPLLQSILRFTVVIVVCYLVSFALSKWLIPLVLGWIFGSVPVWAERIAMLGAQVLFTAFNYAGQRLWAFKD